MDADRFDALSRVLVVAGSRRQVLAAALSGGLALLVTRDAASHNALLACKKKSGKAKKKCVKKAKQHTAQHARETSAVPPPPPGPARKIITQTFANVTPITIPASTGAPASLYPSIIGITEFANGRILDVNLTLHGFSHTFVADIDILLVAGGRNSLVMSDVHGVAVNLTLTLDDQAEAELPDGGTLISGSFRPTNRPDFMAADTFPAPAPTPSGNVALSTFNGGNPNGAWQLFVRDDYSASDTGKIERGWSLEITAEVDA